MAAEFVTDQNQWDSFVDESPCGLIYHKWEFLKLIEKYTGFHLLPYGVYKGNKLICVFPLFYKKILGIRLLFSPPPKSGVPYLGPVLGMDYSSMKQDKKESVLNSIVEEMDAEIKKIRPAYLSVTLVPEFSDIRPFQWRQYQVRPSFTYTIDLRPELTEIWESFAPECRRNIRKGENLNCHAQKCEDTSALTEMLTQRFNQKGLNFSVDPAYLKEALEAYPENVLLTGLYDDSTLIGAVLNQAYHRFIGWIGMPKPKDKKYTYANEFLVWQLIKQAKSMGIEKLEISGANIQNLCHYRSKFNPRLEMYFILSKMNLFGRAAEAFYRRFVKRKHRPTDGK